MVLEGDRPSRGNAGQLRVRDHLDAVQHHGQPIAAHRDLEGVPLADVVVRIAPRCRARAHLRRHRGVRAIAVHLAGSTRPAPDVHLGLARPAQEDA